MALPKWIIENDLCRCCHSDGPYLNLAQPRIVDGEIKVYSKMLQECFNIVVSPVNGVLNEYTYSICENCTNKVRDALSFKQQVLKCEKKFENMYSKNCIVVSELLQEVKTEKDISDNECKSKKYPAKNINISDNEVPENVYDNDDPIVIKNDDGLEDSGDELRFPEEPENGDDNDDLLVAKNDDGLEATGDELRFRQEPENDDDNDDLLVAKNDDGLKVSGDELRLRRVKDSCKRVMQDTDYVKVGQQFRCNHCSNAYMRRQSVRAHIRLCHYELLKESLSQFGMTAAKYVGGNENNEKYYKRVGDLYSCTHCNETFKNSCSITRHIRMAHYTTLKYACKHCNERFGYQSSLSKHTLQAHKVEKPLKDSLKRVIQNNEYVKVGQKYICNHCSKTYIHISSVKLHIRMCHYEVVKGTKCVGGNVNHEKDYKLVGDIYTCTHCNKTYKSSRAATRHIRKSHYKMLKYACKYCNERFGYSGSLTKHTFQAHRIDERQPENVDDNDDPIVNKNHDGLEDSGDELQLPEANHVGGNVNKEKDYKRVGDLYTCTHCNETFKCSRSATSHIRKSHYKTLKYACKHCNERFGYASSLIRHTLQVHKIDERRLSSRIVKKGKDYKKVGDLYTCTHCNRSYKFASTARNHIRAIHYKQLQYKCINCPEGFYHVRALINHKLKVHKVDDRISCNLCDAKYESPNSLRYHKETFHKQGQLMKCPKCDYQTRSKCDMKAHIERKCKFAHKKVDLGVDLDVKENADGKKCDCKTICSDACVQSVRLTYHVTSDLLTNLIKKTESSDK